MQVELHPGLEQYLHNKYSAEELHYKLDVLFRMEFMEELMHQLHITLEEVAVGFLHEQDFSVTHNLLWAGIPKAYQEAFIALGPETVEQRRQLLFTQYYADLQPLIELNEVVYAVSVSVADTGDHLTKDYATFKRRPHAS